MSNTSKNSQVVTLSWYDGKNGHVGPDAPTLVICYDNGRMQIMKHESDDGKYGIDIVKSYHRNNVVSIFSQIVQQLTYFLYSPGLSRYWNDNCWVQMES